MGNLTVLEFVEKYRISRSKAYEEIAAGRLPAIKFGKRTLIAVKDAEAFMATLPRVGAKRAAA